MSMGECRELGLQAAVQLGAKTFPIKFTGRDEDDKAPLTGHGFHNASNDPDEITRLFNTARIPPRAHPGVGLVPGSAGLIVFDIDVKKGGTGWADLAKLEEELGPLPATSMVHTASGGVHFYYRKPESMGHVDNRKIPGADSIDIRCDSGYVVAPGCRTPYYGGGEWVRDETTPPISEAVELPERWAHKISGLDADGNRAPREPIADVVKAGARHANLLRLGGAMRNQGASADEMLAAFRVMNETRFDPPKSEQALVKVARDLEQRYQPEPDWTVILPGQKNESGTLADLLDEEIEPLHFVVDRLLCEGLCLLVGKPKLGKSWLALLVALAVVSGRDVLGRSTKTGEVLCIALEDGKRRIQERVRILGGGRLDRAALQRFHYRTEWPTLDRGGLAQLEQWMEDHPDTRLIVVDTFGRIRGELPGRDRFAEEYNLLAPLQAFATEHRLALVVIHHLRKQAADDWIEQASGSQAITAAADMILGLFRERGQMDATLRFAARDIEEPDLALRFDGGRWESMGDAALYRQSVERTAVLEALEQLGEASASDIAPLVDKKAANVSKMLVGLHSDGLIFKVKRGVYSLSDPVDSVDRVESPNGESTQSTQSTHLQDQYVQGDLDTALALLADAALDFDEESP